MSDWRGICSISCWCMRKLTFPPSAFGLPGVLSSIFALNQKFLVAMLLLLVYLLIIFVFLGNDFIIKILILVSVYLINEEQKPIKNGPRSEPHRITIKMGHHYVQLKTNISRIKAMCFGAVFLRLCDLTTNAQLLVTRKSCPL